MKTINLTIFFFLLVFNISAQKQGNVWCFGNNAGINFNSLPPVVFNSNTVNNESSSVICDSSGNHLFNITQMFNYINNEFDLRFSYLVNKNSQKMTNSDSLNINASATQGALILPLPNSPSLYYIFHIGFFENYQYPLCSNNRMQRYYYSIVDMSKESGLGEVVSKNNILINDWATEKMTAIQHGNGKDWWIIMHGIDDIFYKVLFTGNGIESIKTQNIGPAYNELIINNCYIKEYGQMATSPNGKKIAIANAAKPISSVDIFDFNRCTGKLYNWINICKNIEANYYGLAFSPNNEYLYVSNHGKQISQFNITLADIQSTQFIIAQGTQIGNYFQLQLAPDLKIYVANYESGYLHIIHNPNEQGAASNFEENALWLGGNKSSYGLPNLPNFCLDPLSTIQCITMSVSPEFSIEDFLTGINDFGNGNGRVRVYPNPASTILTIDIKCDDFSNAEFILYNALGQEVMIKAIEANTKNLSIDISKLKTGSYNYTFNINNEHIAFDKIIVIR